MKEQKSKGQSTGGRQNRLEDKDGRRCAKTEENEEER